MLYIFIILYVIYIYIIYITVSLYRSVAAENPGPKAAMKFCIATRSASALPGAGRFSFGVFEQSSFHMETPNNRHVQKKP